MRQDENGDTDGIRDTRMRERAIRERWEIPADRKQKALDRQLAIACGEDDDASLREQTSAFKSVLAAEAQNIAEEHKELDRLDAGRNRILDLLERSGADASSLISDSGRKAITDGSGGPAPQGLREGHDEREHQEEKRGVSPPAIRGRFNSRDSKFERRRKKKKK